MKKFPRKNTILLANKKKNKHCYSLFFFRKKGADNKLLNFWYTFLSNAGNVDERVRYGGMILPEMTWCTSCSSFWPSSDSRASTMFLPNVRPKLSTNCGRTSSTVMVRLSCSDSDVVSFSASPQGTIFLNQERSTSQFMARPWLLTYRCNWTPANQTWGHSTLVQTHQPPPSRWTYLALQSYGCHPPIHQYSRSSWLEPHTAYMFQWQPFLDMIHST